MLATTFTETAAETAAGHPRRRHRRAPEPDRRRTRRRPYRARLVSRGARADFPAARDPPGPRPPVRGGCQLPHEVRILDLIAPAPGPSDAPAGTAATSPNEAAGTATR